MSDLRLGLGLVTVRPDHVGGAEVYARGLLRALPRTGDVEHTALLANAEVARAYSTYAGERLSLRIVKGIDPTGNALARSLEMAKAMVAPSSVLGHLADDLDLVHFPVWAAVPRPRGPFVVTTHDLQHRALPELFTRRRRAYRTIVYEGSAKRAALVITDSDAARADILMHLGLDADRVAAIHLAVDHDRFRPIPDDSDDEARLRLALPRRFIFYPANLWPHKNHAALLRALPFIDDEVDLVLAGQTHGAGGWLEEQAARAGVADRVRHLGYVSDLDLPRIYRAATCMVFPSLYEGFGLPILEAMACGCPVTIADAEASVEAGGDAAVRFDGRDEMAIAAAVQTVLGWTGPERAERTAHARRHSLRFTWSRAAEEHVAAYRRALGG